MLAGFRKDAEDRDSINEDKEKGMSKLEPGRIKDGTYDSRDEKSEAKKIRYIILTSPFEVCTRRSDAWSGSRMEGRVG